MRTLTAAVVLAVSAGCAPGAEGPPRPRDEILVAADAPGNAVHPAEVQLLLKKGALRLAPGPPGAHLVAGTLRAGDPTVLPHVTVNTRGIALVQDFAPDDGAPSKISWDLKLGATPMRLSVHVLGSEEQRVDLGGCPVVSARLYNEGGHLQADWSAPNPLVAEHLELWSVGYLEARHVARSGAKRIEVKSVGLAEIDLGDHVDADLRIDIEGSSGQLALTLPADVTARATLEAPAGGRIEAEGWNDESGGVHTLGSPAAAARVTIVMRSIAGVVRLRTSPPRPR